MRDSGTCAGRFLRRVCTGFIASYRPPAAGILWQLAHFGATSRRLGVCTVAVATGNRRALEAAGGISQDGKNQRAGEHGAFHGGEEDKFAGAPRKESRHGKSFNGKQKKTDSSGILIGLLPGSWYGVV